jgi:hypothetical protein
MAGRAGPTKGNLARSSRAIDRRCMLVGEGFESANFADVRIAPSARYLLDASGSSASVRPPLVVAQQGCYAVEVGVVGQRDDVQPGGPLLAGEEFDAATDQHGADLRGTRHRHDGRDGGSSRAIATGAGGETTIHRDDTCSGVASDRRPDFGIAA